MRPEHMLSTNLAHMCYSTGTESCSLDDAVCAPLPSCRQKRHSAGRSSALALLEGPTTSDQLFKLESSLQSAYADWCTGFLVLVLDGLGAARCHHYITVYLDGKCSVRGAVKITSPLCAFEALSSATALTWPYRRCRQRCRKSQRNWIKEEVEEAMPTGA